MGEGRRSCGKPQWRRTATELAAATVEQRLAPGLIQAVAGAETAGIPFAGWLADRRGWNAKWVVGGVTAAQLALAIALFVQAKAGQPFWPA